MINHRTEIVAAFEDLIELCCAIGLFLHGDSADGIRVQFWRNGQVREICEFMSEMRNGVQIRYAPNGMLSSIVHYRNSQVYGQKRVCDPSGHVLKSVMVKDEVEVREKDADLAAFEGYLVTNDELAIVRRYDGFGKFLRNYRQR